MEKLIFSFLRVTQEAAIATAKASGSGDKKYADKIATETMRRVFNSISFKGKVVIGEGERDEAPMLYIGEELGDRCQNDLLAVDIAVDPLENTNATAKSLFNAITVMAASEKGGLLSAPDVYLEKLVVGAQAKGKIDIRAPVKENLKSLSRALGKEVADLKVIILERNRHQKLIEEVRETGARIKLILDGDLLGGLSALIPGPGIDALMGIGAAPEGVITAAAVRCLEGEMQARFVTSKEEESGKLVVAKGLDPKRVYQAKDLVSGKQVFFGCTGVTKGDIVNGVQFLENGVKTQSLFLYRSPGQVFASLVDSLEISGREELNISTLLK